MGDNKIAIGIDFTKSYLRVAGLLINKNEDTFNVIQGSKDVKVCTDDFPDELVVGGLNDASNVVKSSMGGADINCAFVVVLNSTSSKNRDAIASLAKKTICSDIVVVSEHTAVAAAYASKVKPYSTVNLAILSFIGDLIDVTVVSIKPKDLTNNIYEYNGRARIIYPQHIDFDQLESIQKQLQSVKDIGSGLPIIGSAVSALTDALAAGFNAIKSILLAPTLNTIPNVDAVVLTGNNKIPNLLRAAFISRYPDAKLWEEFKIDEVAAYGAAVLAYNYIRVKTGAITLNGSQTSANRLADNQIAIGIDFTKSYLRVAGLINEVGDTYSVIQGTKDVKVKSEEDFPEGVVSAGFKDAGDVVKSKMGGKNIEGSFVVVLNYTSSKNRDATSSLGTKSICSALQVVLEYTAVAAAYASKLKPHKSVNLAIVSFIGEILDITIVSVEPKGLPPNQTYDYNLQAEVTYPQHIDFVQLETIQKQLRLAANSTQDIPIVGAAANALADTLIAGLNTVKAFLNSPELSKISNVEAVVFTGNNKIPNMLSTAVKERFPDAKLWDQFKIDEVAAYGAAVLAFNKIKAAAA